MPVSFLLEMTVYLIASRSPPGLDHFFGESFVVVSCGCIFVRMIRRGDICTSTDLVKKKQGERDKGEKEKEKERKETLTRCDSPLRA